MSEHLSRSADFSSESSILNKSYVCVYYGCSKRPSYVIDVIEENQLDNFIVIVGGNPKEELQEKYKNKPDKTFESMIKTFNDLDCPKNINYKVFRIKYEENPHMCAIDYGEKMYCIQKSYYSVKQILDWVKAAQKF